MSVEPYVWAPPPRPPKFQDRRRKHALLLAATFLTTTYAPSLSLFVAGLASGVVLPVPFGWEVFLAGLWYSIPLLVILGAHEMGHYLACRRYDVDASLPFFLPAPGLLTGTLGAVIRIREPFPSKRALFDIAIAGPIAGFVALVPFLVAGVWMSTAGPVPDGSLFFGEPLLFRVLELWRFGELPPGTDTLLHSMGFAAWFGMLATALNLMPFGQLDGGHIAYAVFGRRAWLISLGTLVATIILTIVSLSWISMALIMLAMAFFLGLRHPQIGDDGVPLDAGRKALAVVALLIFAVCFTPVPIEIFFGS